MQTFSVGMIFLSLFTFSLSTGFLMSCKARKSGKGSVKDSNVLQFGTDERVVLYAKDGNIFAVTCSLKDIEDTSENNNIDIAFLSRTQCNESKNMYQMLPVADYKERLRQVLNFDDGAYKAAKNFLNGDAKEIPVQEFAIKRSKDRLETLESGGVPQAEEGQKEKNGEQPAGGKYIDTDAINAEKKAIKDMESELAVFKVRQSEQLGILAKHEQRRNTVDALIAKLSEEPKDMTNEQRRIYENENTFMLKSLEGSYLLAPFSDDAMKRWNSPTKINPVERDMYLATAKSREWIVGEPESDSKFATALDFCKSKGARLPSDTELDLLNLYGESAGDLDVISKIGSNKVVRTPIKIVHTKSEFHADFNVFAKDGFTFRGPRNIAYIENWKYDNLTVYVKNEPLKKSNEKSVKNVSVCVKGMSDIPSMYIAADVGRVNEQVKSDFFLCNANFTPGTVYAKNFFDGASAFKEMGNDWVVRCAGYGPTMERAVSHINSCVREVTSILNNNGNKTSKPIGTSDQWCGDFSKSL